MSDILSYKCIFQKIRKTQYFMFTMFAITKFYNILQNFAARMLYSTYLYFQVRSVVGRN